jgi:3'-5' exoribonuclease
MTQPQLPLTSLGKLAPGERGDFFALLAEKTRGRTRENKSYYACRFRDATRMATFMVWNDSPWFEACERDWQAGHFYKLRAVYSEHERYGPQLRELIKIREVTKEDESAGFDPSQLIERSRLDSEAMFADLVALVQSNIADAPLQRLVVELLTEHGEQLKVIPATRDRFYPFAGGWLEHTLSVTRICVDLAGRFANHYVELRPPLNRDLVVAGAALHDIGRVLELTPDVIASTQTVPGRLFGHLLLGRDLVRDKAKQLGDVAPELVELLEHIVLTHLSLPEWGSPRLPLIPEVLIIHHADDLDAKMEMYARCLSRDHSEGPFTERDPFLNRSLLKERSV